MVLLTALLRCCCQTRLRQLCGHQHAHNQKSLPSPGCQPRCVRFVLDLNAQIRSTDSWPARAAKPRNHSPTVQALLRQGVQLLPSPPHSLHQQYIRVCPRTNISKHKFRGIFQKGAFLTSQCWKTPHKHKATHKGMRHEVGQTDLPQHVTS